MIILAWCLDLILHFFSGRCQPSQPASTDVKSSPCQNNLVLYTSTASRENQAQLAATESAELSRMPRLLLSLPSSSSSVQPPLQTLQTVKIISRSALHAGGNLKSLILKAAPITVQDIKTSGKTKYFLSLKNKFG
jgi:hypothetical protein